MERKQVYALIDGERDYQDRRWNEGTTSSGGIHSPEEWLIYMQDYLTEAIHFASRANNEEAFPKVMASIRKITAMGVAAMEQIPTPARTE